jgi:hypothetical protein
MYEDLKTNDPKNLYKPAKTRKRRAMNTYKMSFIKNKEERILSEDHKFKERWRGYFNHLLNTKNSSKELEETDIN